MNFDDLFWCITIRVKSSCPHFPKPCPSGDDEQFNLASVELEKILADGHVAPKTAKGGVSYLLLVINNEDRGMEWFIS